MNTFTTKMASLGVSLMLCLSAQAQYAVTPNQSAQDIVDYLTGLNVTTTNAVLLCDADANGIFTYGGSILPMADGITLGTSNVNDYGQPASVFLSTGSMGPGDQTLTDVIGAPTFSACVLECDVVAVYDTLYLNYSFASEEYPEYNCSAFNDAFGFFITGPGFPTPTNFALVPGTNIITAINSVNDGTNPSQGVHCSSMGPGSPFTQYYIDNASGTDFTFDGMTQKVEAFIVVNTGTSYHLKFVVANATDNIYQSSVFMEGSSLSSKNASTTKVASVNMGGNTLVYPNPFKDDMSVTLPENLLNKTVDVMVVNSVGQNVYHYNGIGGGLNESIRHKAKVLNQGIYTMTIRSEEYEQVVKFQKQ